MQPITCFRARFMKEHLRNDCKDSISVWHIFIPCVTWADFNNAVKISSTLHKQTHYFWLCAAFPACHGSKESCKRWGGEGGKPNQMARHMEESDIYLGTQTGGEELCLKVLSVKEHESGTVTVT